MNFPRIAKAIGFEGPEFETQDGAIALSVDHMSAIEKKLTNHSAAKEQWKADKLKMDNDHQTAIATAVSEATKEANEKLAAANTALAEATTELSAAKEKIRVLEEEPADKATVLNPAGNPKADKTEYSFSEAKFKKK